MKKLLVGIIGVLTVLTALPLFSAFEAHIINVSATIENALSVNATALDFGTVFPQEHLKKPLTVQLSGSFLAESRVEDVGYFIRQKPKCAVTWDDGQSFDSANTKTGHVMAGDNPATTDVEEDYWIDCGETPRALTEGETWGVLPSLCEYLSKEAVTEVGRSPNDETQPSFHVPFKIFHGDNQSTPDVVETDWVYWKDTEGLLSKTSPIDPVDNWLIDLAVPCFGGHCAQDWNDFVHSLNPAADPTLFIQPIENEHKVFGCDLWVEVSGVIPAPTI